MYCYHSISVLLILCLLIWNKVYATKDLCYLPIDTGPCRGDFPRWYYESEYNECVEFSYGGCGGNANRFFTKEECMHECDDVCLLLKDAGPCRASIPRWYYNRESNDCKEFTYGGCQGNGNRFSTEKECKTECVKDACSFPIDPGFCSAALRRWYYSNESNECKEFTYGGCQGNGNRFSTEKECKTKCVKDACSFPKDSGYCLAANYMWYYNSESGQCEKFTYGGCEGNGNRFSTAKECITKCVKVCSIPKDVGPCRGSIPMWYYNSESGQCEEFTYGGCQGNGNRFSTQEECQTACSDPCLLPKQQGPCRGDFPSWFYNAESFECEKFVYGGCQGNANRFSTEDECWKSCDHYISSGLNS